MMRPRHTPLSPIAACRALGLAGLLCLSAVPGSADPATTTPVVGVGSQYDTAHVYVAAADLEPFVRSFTATFGGKSTAPLVMTITPTPSSTTFQAAVTPAGSISGFGFKTPIPYPFGLERTGYLVTDMDVAVKAARANGAAVVVEPFNDPIGRDAIIQWPGGVMMQLYWHTTAPTSAALATVPENRVYVSPDSADAFIRDFVAFSHGTVVSDVAKAPGTEIGAARVTYRRVRIESIFGKMTVLVTNGQLVYPYGRETTGYEVANLADTLKKAIASGAVVLVTPYTSDGRLAAMVQFPGGYVAEIHATVQ